MVFKITLAVSWLTDLWCGSFLTVFCLIGENINLILIVVGD